MKNKTARICLFLQSLCKLFLVISLLTMDNNIDNLTATASVNCVSDIICLYWIIDGLEN